MNISKKIWIPLLVLMTMLVLRESGCVIIHFAKSQFENQMKIDLRSDFYVNQDGRQFPSYEERKIDNQKPGIVEMSWKIEIDTDPQATVLTSVEEQLQRKSNEDPGANVTFHNTKLTGFYWLPLYKRGTCEYSFDIEVPGEDSKVYRGTGNGEMKFSTFGLFSINDAKSIISDRIAADVVSTLKSQTK